MACESCGDKPKKCNKEFTKAVIEIDNPEQITLMRKVVIPASMGDDTTVPPVVGKYKNVLLYYESNKKSYLYSSDGIPTQLVNGITNYEDAINLPQINGVTLLGDKSAADLKLADAPMVITVADGNTSWSGADTAEDVYSFFLNKGKVNIVFNGGENYAYEVTSAAYIPGEEKMMCTLAVATIATGESAEFDGNALFGTMTLYTADKAIDVSQIELQPKLFVADFTGLDLNYDTLSGVPATNASIGMVKPGDGLEVASDGTLSVDDVAFVFDTVADMKASTDLSDGDYAKTLGYYASNDNGGASYRISSTAPTGYYETLTSGLYAELIITVPMNVRQFGAKGDGVTDDSSSIQTALDNSSTVIVPDGTYMVDASAHDYPNSAIVMNSGNKLILENDAIIKMIPNNLGTYRIILVSDVTNVEICGGTLEGDRNTHTGTTGEWGHCIAISGTSDNIYIHDMYLKDAWGDGISFGASGRIKTERVHVDNVRRNGYSVINAGELISQNDFIENVGGETGTAPKDGIDIEPDTDAQSVRAIFNNLRTKNNTHIGFSLYHVRDNSTPMYIELNNYYSDGDSNGIWLETGADAKGDVIINNPYIINSTSTSGAIRVVPTGLNYRFKIVEPIIEKYKITSTAQAGLYIAGHSNVISGNIEIINPTIIVPNADEGISNTSAIRIEAVTNGGYSNLKIINPLDFGGKIITTNGTYTSTIIRDDFNTCKIEQNSALNIGAGAYYSLVTSGNYTANRNVTVKSASTIPIGSRIKFMNTGDYKMNIIFESQYIYPLASTTGATVTLNDKGDMIEIERLSATEWTVINSVGNVTVA